MPEVRRNGKGAAERLSLKFHRLCYNFARIHKALKITPSMAAGLSGHICSLEEIVQMADNYLPKAAKRGPYKKRS
jgi:hypothetical protein